MKLYEKHERYSLVTRWTGRYKNHVVEIEELRNDSSFGPVTGYWFFCKRDNKAYNSLWLHKPYKTRDDAEAAAIKYVDDEVKEVNNDEKC